LFTHLIKHIHSLFHIIGGCYGRDRMVVRFKTTYTISEFESCSWRGVLDTTLCDKVFQ